MPEVLEYLEGLGIAYVVHHHKPVFTVDEAKDVRIDADFGENKNLFLRNRKGDVHYLVTIAAEKQLNLKSLAEALQEKSVGFASPERLLQYLHLTPGSVSPFGLVHKSAREVRFILDTDLLAHTKLGFHPNTNTQTLVLETEDFKKYLAAIGNPVQYLPL